MRFFTKAWILIYLFGILACVPPSTKEEMPTVELSLQNPTVQSIFDLQNTANLDSLSLLLNHPSPIARYLSANAFASNKPGNHGDALVSRLEDPNLNVRTVASYALGQSGNEIFVSDLLTSFKDRDTISVNNAQNGNILESVGKIADKTQLENLATINTYTHTDTLLLLGQVRGIYRFGIRGIYSQKGTETMVNILKDVENPSQVRLIAAHYLSRAKTLNIESYKFALADLVRNESNEDIRMAIYYSLRHTKDPKIRDFLMARLDTETDYRSKVNIIRALGSFRYIQVVDKIISFLKDENTHVAKTAANYLVMHGKAEDASFYKEFSQDITDWNVKTTLLKSVTKHLPHYFDKARNGIRKEALNAISQSQNPYEQAEYLAILGNDIDSYSALKDMALNSTNPLLKNKSAEAIASIITNDKIKSYLKNGLARFKRTAAADVQELIEQGDVGVVYTLANLISDGKSGLEEFISADDYLVVALSKLQMPKHVETYNALVKAIKKINPSTTKTNATPSPNKNIVWEDLSKYGNAPTATVTTSKGVIRLQLYPYEAPLSTYNFIDLSNKKFYDNKTFHRVVPNFVIQGGCPRGDGFGSEDYTLRSELSQKYYDEAGYVGMASAGPHTESTQFFITHSPAPHLDGKYTIFGKVISGMDVVHSIQQGDKIQNIVINN